jgi:membrane-bound serine protease (ClpP class)
MLIGLAVALIAALASPSPVRAATSPSLADPARAAVVALKGEINHFNQRMFERHFKQALDTGAQTVVIDLDTYGGLVSAGLEISHFLKAQKVHTIAYVNNKAISAGAMIALACDEIVMAPVATMGDCAPIAVDPTGGLAPMPAAERAKAESPILADFRDSALTNGYDPLVALSMVSVERAVYWVENAGGERKFVDATGYKDLKEEGWKQVTDGNVPTPIDAENTLLTVNSDLAMKLGLARGTAGSVDELLSQRNLQLTSYFEIGGGEKLIGILDSPAFRALLLTIFMTTLYISLHAPGHGFAEVICVVAISLLIGIPALTGYAQWWEILAILVGIGLLAIELFVIPGFGVTGITGIAMIVIGLLMTFVAPEPGRSPLNIPSLPMSWSGLQQGLMVIVGGLFASIFLSMWIRRYLPSLPYFNRLVLNTVVGSESGMVGSLTNIDPSEQHPAIGATAKAMTDLKPGGTAEFRDAAGNVHSVAVVSDSGYVPRGASLVVREVGGNRIVVRAVTTTTETAAKGEGHANA